MSDPATPDGLILWDSFNDNQPFIRASGYNEFSYTPKVGRDALVRYWEPGQWAGGALGPSHVAFAPAGGKFNGGAAFNYSGSDNGGSTMDEIAYSIGDGISAGGGAIEFWYKPLYDSNDDSAILTLFSMKSYVNKPNSVYDEARFDGNAAIGLGYYGWSGRKFFLNYIIDTGGPSVEAQTPGEYRSDRFMFDADEWMHFAVVWDQEGISNYGTKTLMLFIDGVEVASSSQAFSTPQGFDQYLILGASPGSGFNVNSPMKPYGGSSGSFDNLKVWDFAKTDFSDRFVEGFGAPSAETVTVRLGGTGGPDRGPAFRVWADGEIIGQGVVDDPQTMAEFRRFGRDWTDFTFAVDAAPETVEVEFLNDGRDPGTGEDVNLFVDSVSFGGEVYQAENYGWFTPRNGNPANIGPRENLWWNGRLSFSERGDPEPGDLLFADDFVIYDKLSPEWTVVHPNAWIEDGWLHLQDRDGGARNALISTHDSDPGWTDYSVRCTVDFVDIGWLDSFALVLRAKGFSESTNGMFGSGYQLFAYGPTGWEAEKRNTLVLFEFVDPDPTDGSPGARTELLRVRHDFSTEPFEVIASVEGGRVRAWVDDELLIDHLDPTPRDHGGIALEQIWELHSRFDDVEVVAGAPEDAGWLV